jgi:NTP pyrophosphatase (non-canonical NTP hydrolase)
VGERDAETLLEALNTFGCEAQVRMLQEECAELIAAINQWWRNRVDTTAVAEEIADVEIMCAQVRIMVSGAAVDKAKEAKMARLRERLAERVEQARGQS